MAFAFLKKYFDQKKVTLLLKLFLSIDILFILGHVGIVLFWNAKPDTLLLDAKGLGYPELFQYFKYVIIMFFVGHLIFIKKEYVYMPFLVLFLILLIDDAYQIHSKASWFFVHLFNLHAVLGIRGFIFGQLIYAMVMGSFLFGFSSLFYLKASERIRHTFLDIFMLFTVFLFFGLGIDVVHNLLEHVYMVSPILTLIEEGGEMIALSVLAWYFCFLVLTPDKKRRFLYHYFFSNWKLKYL